jgi:hypothetical protein
MRLARFSLVLIFLGVVSSLSYSQTLNDPKAIVNALGDPTCATPGFLCYTGDGTFGAPLVENFTSPIQFVYEGTATQIFSLWIDLTNVPALTEFQCQTNIWTNCSIVSDAYGPTTVGFHLSGGGPLMPGDVGGTCNPCDGFLTKDEGVGFTLQPLISETPEPGAMLLFGTGLLAILSVAKRRLTPVTESDQIL